MLKRILIASASLLVLFATAPAFAMPVDPASTQAVKAPATIDHAIFSCIRTAVQTRETTLGSAIAAHSQSVQAAYGTRASSLASAYATETTAKGVKTKTKAAWSAFTTATKDAAKAWRTSRADAWKAFRTSAKACKSSGDLTDSANAGSELSGS